jgi:sarcosine oxidase subunit beta
MSEVLRERAPVVIVGAGCIGASIAYQLSRRGVRGVVVLEREPFAGAGSTGKAAGGIRAQFSTPISVRISQLAIAHFERFSEEMQADPVFFQVGYLFLLAQESRWRAFQAQAEMQRGLGLPVQTLSPREAQEIVPQIVVDDLLGATYCAKDGLGNPHEVTQAYVSRARALGAHFEFQRAATGLCLEGNTVVGVETEKGPIDTPMVVNGAGPHAAEVARWAGVDLPVQPFRRHCFTTHPLPFVHERMPMIVDMASGVYMHRESGGMLLGLANPDEPPGFETGVDWDFLPRVVEPAIRRLPALEDAEIANGWAGLYETTPDHNAVLGPPAGVRGVMLANGFSGHGFMQAPAVGQLIAEWIVDGRPSLDLHELRLERFAQRQAMVEANVI